MERLALDRSSDIYYGLLRINNRLISLLCLPLGGLGWRYEP